jgi:hypothetical protein
MQNRKPRELNPNKNRESKRPQINTSAQLSSKSRNGWQPQQQGTQSSNNSQERPQSPPKHPHTTAGAAGTTLHMKEEGEHRERENQTKEQEKLTKYAYNFSRVVT